MPTATVAPRCLPERSGKRVSLEMKSELPSAGNWKKQEDLTLNHFLSLEFLDHCVIIA